jgi:regulatory protein
MPTVATIRRRRGAVAIQLDGETVEHLLAREPVEACALREGTALGDKEWAELRSLGRRRLAFERALASLARRSHTTHELRQRLTKQFQPDEIDPAIERLIELGYLNDSRWATEFVEARRHRFGGRRLRQELARRGVARETVEVATGDLDDASAAIAVARRRLPALRRLDPEQRKRRLYGYLQRRGFGHDATQRALVEVLDAERQLD